MIPEAGKRDIDVGKWLTEAVNLTFEGPFVGIQLAVGLVAGIILAVAGMTFIGPLFVQFPILCGLFYFARKRMQEQQVEFGDLFRGFDVFTEGFLASLALYAALIVLGPITLVVFLVFFSCCFPIPMIAMLLFSALLYTFTVGLIPGLLFDRRMKAWEAIRLNYAFSIANFAPLFLYHLVIAAVLWLGGAIAFVGLIVAIPFAAFAGAIQYREWIGFAQGQPRRFDEMSEEESKPRE